MMVIKEGSIWIWL